MINIIISDDNSMLCYGLEHIFKNMAAPHNMIQFNITRELTIETVSKADLIIKSYSNGEVLICQSIIRERNQHAIIIALTDCNDVASLARRPQCLYNAVFVDKTITPAEFETIIRRWCSSVVSSRITRLCVDCSRCNYFSLNGMELKIANFILSGYESRQIAHKIGINIKTVYAHKYNIMKKLGLRSTQDLYKFLCIYHSKFGLKYLSK